MRVPSFEIVGLNEIISPTFILGAFSGAEYLVVDTRESGKQISKYHDSLSVDFAYKSSRCLVVFG